MHACMHVENMAQNCGLENFGAGNSHTPTLPARHPRDGEPSVSVLKFLADQLLGDKRVIRPHQNTQSSTVIQTSYKHIQNLPSAGDS
jgi:hypothetical protein